ncbi:MAG TPA: TetR/AcrR family transcriptional regulator [Pseudonocardia sp.]|nr:TetR/AcrR family transcriptional regulator [Pseudonocardia sp.]
MTETEQRPDARERKKRATRRALRAATVDLGLQRGLSAVRVEEIAEQAGVSPRTFFNYFETKEDAALLDLLTVTDDELAELAAGGPTDDVWAELTRLFAADVERADHDGPELPRVMELQRREPVLQGRQMARFARFEARLATAIGARLPDDDTARLTARLMSGSCITAVRVGLERWGHNGRQGSPRPHVEAAFAVFAPAFRPGA